MTETPSAYGAMPQSDFEAQYKRVLEAAECRTQVQLADFLQVRQSSVSDAKRRKSIPAEWRIKLFEKRRINPEWILHGGDIKYLAPADPAQSMLHVVRVTEVRPPEECTAQELFNELVRRAQKKPDDEQIQKEAAETWLPAHKATDTCK